MSRLEMIGERIAYTVQITVEALAHGARDYVNGQIVHAIDSTVRGRFDLAASERDVVIEEVSDSTLELQRDRHRKGLHTFRGRWRPSPTRGVLVIDRDDLVTMQPNLPHEIPDRLTVPMTDRDPLAVEHGERADGALYLEARWQQTTLVYQGIHRGSGLLVYRVLP